MNGRRRYAIAAAVWIAGLTLLSFLPPHDKHELHTKGRFHSVAHCGAFLVAAMLVTASARTARTRVLALTSVALLGIGVEFLQHVVNHMYIEWNAVVMDLLGVALGALLLAVMGGMRAPSAADCLHGRRR